MTREEMMRESLYRTDLDVEITVALQKLVRRYGNAAMVVEKIGDHLGTVLELELNEKDDDTLKNSIKILDDAVFQASEMI